MKKKDPSQLNNSIPKGYLYHVLQLVNPNFIINVRYLIPKIIKKKLFTRSIILYMYIKNKKSHNEFKLFEMEFL